MAGLAAVLAVVTWFVRCVRERYSAIKKQDDAPRKHTEQQDLELDVSARENPVT
jgi:hypothetical protein